MANIPNDKLNKYQVQSVLKEGNFSQTLSAINSDTQQAVIIKELHFKRLKNWKSLELFEREAKILQSLDHPRIPKLIEFIQVEEDDEYILYLITEKVKGKTLAQRLDQGWHPTEKEVKKLCMELLDILSYLHQLNPPVIHRDIKPSNLVLDENNHIHLIDFGAVQHMLHPEGSSTVVGTYGYMAPEQFSGKAVPASDLYGLGATLIHVLSGKAPSQLPQKELRLDFKEHVNISKGFSLCIDRLIEPMVEKRFQLPDDVLKQLKEGPQVYVAPSKLSDISSEIADVPLLPPRLKTIQDGQNLHITLPPGKKNLENIGGNMKSASGGVFLILLFYLMRVDQFSLSLDPSLVYINYALTMALIVSLGLASVFMLRLYNNLISRQIDIILTPDTYEIHYEHGFLKKKVEGQTKNIKGLFSSTKSSYLEQLTKSPLDESYILHAEKPHSINTDLSAGEYRELQETISQ